MQNHYELVRDVRRKMRLREQISLDDIIDYYWSLHRLHEYHISKSTNPLNRNRHIRKSAYFKDMASAYFKDMAEEFEEKAYLELSKRIIEEPQSEMERVTRFN